MFKCNKIISVFIIVLCIFLGGCQDDKKYLGDTKRTFDLMVENSSICHEILMQYSIIANTNVARFVSQQVFEDIFFKTYVATFGQNSDKFSKLESKTIEENMAKLHNPPKKYENTYNKMLELYGAYSKIQQVVLDRRGTQLRNGLKDINNTLEEIIILKKQLNVMLGDKPL